MTFVPLWRRLRLVRSASACPMLWPAVWLTESDEGDTRELEPPAMVS